MKCIEGCDKGQCTKDRGCLRVGAMARFITDAREKPPHTTTLTKVVTVGGITEEQWRADYTKEETPCFKRAVEEELGGKIVYQQERVAGKNTRAVRRLSFR